MIKFDPRAWLLLAAGAVLYTGAVSGVAYWKGGQHVKNRYEVALKEGRIKVIEQVGEADNEIDPADDDLICALLGGCLPNDEGGS